MTLDREYLFGRAEAELRMAKKATDPAAIRAHTELAHLYLAQMLREIEPERTSVVRFGR